MSRVCNLGDRVITAALTDEVITGTVKEYVDGLSGMQSVSMQARFIYGSGGTTVVAVVQTSLDLGATWIDIARFDFTNSNSQRIANISGIVAATPATVAVLASQGKLDGILGDRLRCAVTSTGTYGANTTLSVRACPR